MVLNRMISKIKFVSIIISIMYTSAFAINCYQCNSYENEECHNLGQVKPHLRAAFLKECDDSKSLNGSTPFCRKSVFTIKFPDGQKRTIRSCGWIKGRLPCYNADNDDHQESQCQCFENECNGSSRIQVYSTTGFLIVMFNLYCFVKLL